METLIDLCFMVDVFLNCITSYEQDDGHMITDVTRIVKHYMRNELHEIQTRFHRSVDSLRDVVEANRSTLEHVEALLMQSLENSNNNSAQSRISSRRSSIAMLTRRKSGSPLPSLARRSSMSSPHHQNPFAAVLEKRVRKRSSIGSLFDTRLAQKQQLRSKRRLSSRPTQDYSTDNINKNSTSSSSSIEMRKFKSSASSQFKKPLISEKSLFT